MARLVEGVADKTPTSARDRIDALFVEGIATLETGSDDAYALRILRKPATMDPTPRKRLFAGIATDKSVQERLERVRDADTARHPAWQVDRTARMVARERCETAFLMAVNRGYHGDRKWVGDVTRVARPSPPTSEAGWAARAVASRWRTSR